jgi:hypothetical protein
MSKATKDFKRIDTNQGFQTAMFMLQEAILEGWRVDPYTPPFALMNQFGIPLFRDLEGEELEQSLQKSVDLLDSLPKPTEEVQEKLKERSQKRLNKTQP